MPRNSFDNLADSSSSLNGKEAPSPQTECTHVNNGAPYLYLSLIIVFGNGHICLNSLFHFPEIDQIWIIIDRQSDDRLVEYVLKQLCSPTHQHASTSLDQASQLRKHTTHIRQVRRYMHATFNHFRQQQLLLLQAICYGYVPTCVCTSIDSSFLSDGRTDERTDNSGFRSSSIISSSSPSQLPTANQLAFQSLLYSGHALFYVASW